MSIHELTNYGYAMETLDNVMAELMDRQESDPWTQDLWTDLRDVRNTLKDEGN